MRKNAALCGNGLNRGLEKKTWANQTTADEICQKLHANTLRYFLS